MKSSAWWRRSVLGLALLAMPMTASADSKRIALLTTPNAQAFMATWVKTFMAGAPALGMTATQRTSPFDAALQSQQLDDAIGQHFDAILLNNIDPVAIQPALSRAKAAGIPVFLVVNPGAVGSENLYVSFIGTNQTELGRLAGESTVAVLRQTGKTRATIVALTGGASQLNTINRMNGFRAALAATPDFKIAAQEDAKWNTELSGKIAGDLLVRFAGQGGIDVIYGMADNQVAAAIQAVQAADLPIGLEQKGIILVGSNCMKEGIANIRDGLEYSTNTQLPTAEAELALHKVAAFFAGQTLQKNEYVPISVINRANVDQFAAACSY
jgi:ribose transport system substrate-binding protein